MTKKKAQGKQNVSQSSQRSVSSPSSVTQVIFPAMSPKVDLECRTILEDQILVIDDILLPEECKAFVKFIDTLPLELTPPKRRGEADRVNQRFSVSSATFAASLHALLLPHLPSFPYPTSMRRAPIIADQPRKPDSCNSNIRVYKYAPSQYFGPHYDDSVRDAITGVMSEWTLLIYLTGIEDGVEGGETIFYKDEKGKPRQAITPSLKRGTALLHRYGSVGIRGLIPLKPLNSHGQECMLHEGSPVLKGTKYVLRSDLMFTK